MDVDIAIVGSGFSGLGLAVRLRQEGVEDFVVLERGDGRRRHVALQHVSGLRLRRARRTCTRSRSRRTPTGRGPTRASPRSARTWSAWSTTSGCAPKIRLDLRGDAARSGTARAGTLETTQGAVRARVLVSGTGPLVEPKFPDFPGLESFAGADVALRPLGPRRRPAREARGERRHRRVGDPVRARDRPRRRAAARDPAHAAVGDAAQRAADLAPGAARSSSASRPRSARCAAGSTPRASCWCSASSSTRARMKLLERAGAGTASRR